MIYVLPRGGFGNVMFNYLIGKTLCKKYIEPVCFIKKYSDKRKLMCEYDLFKNCSFIERVPKGTRLIREKNFKFNKIPELNTKNNYLLDGYFQSYKYSQEYFEEIKKELFGEINKFENTVMLHVRRGDYLSLSAVHPVQSIEYYKKSLEIIKDCKVLVFSDDIPHIKTWDFLKNYEVEFIDKDVEDCFQLMIRCNHFIISNSTLSLLAYYFGKEQNSKIVMPKKWFGPRGPDYNLDDLIEKTDNTFFL